MASKKRSRKSAHAGKRPMRVEDEPLYMEGRAAGLREALLALAGHDAPGAFDDVEALLQGAEMNKDLGRRVPSAKDWEDFRAAARALLEPPPEWKALEVEVARVGALAEATEKLAGLLLERVKGMVKR